MLYPSKAQAVLEQLKEVSVGEQPAEKQEQSPNGNNSNKTEEESKQLIVQNVESDPTETDTLCVSPDTELEIKKRMYNGLCKVNIKTTESTTWSRPRTGPFTPYLGTHAWNRVLCLYWRYWYAHGHWSKSHQCQSSNATVWRKCYFCEMVSLRNASLYCDDHYLLGSIDLYVFDGQR